ncbi:MAG: CRISPR-associated endonuclease Cas1 [Holdemanella porci]
MCSKDYKDGRVLVNQLNKYRDESQRLYFQSPILKASIKNMLSVLKYYRKKGRIWMN